MHDLVARKVREHPAKEAVCALGLSWSYGELDGMADRLARVLMARGVGPGAIVPYMFEKTPFTAVTMLATLKAGGAFVPLDPGHQWADTAGLLKSCQAGLVLCSPAHQQRFLDNAVDIIVIDEAYVERLKAEAAAAAAAGDEPVQSPARPSDPGLRHLHVG